MPNFGGGVGGSIVMNRSPSPPRGIQGSSGVGSSPPRYSKSTPRARGDLLPTHLKKSPNRGSKNYGFPSTNIEAFPLTGNYINDAVGSGVNGSGGAGGRGGRGGGTTVFQDLDITDDDIDYDELNVSFTGNNGEYIVSREGVPILSSAALDKNIMKNITTTSGGGGGGNDDSSVNYKQLSKSTEIKPRLKNKTDQYTDDDDEIFGSSSGGGSSSSSSSGRISKPSMMKSANNFLNPTSGNNNNNISSISSSGGGGGGGSGGRSTSPGGTAARRASSSSYTTTGLSSQHFTQPPLHTFTNTTIIADEDDDNSEHAVSRQDLAFREGNLIVV